MTARSRPAGLAHLLLAAVLVVLAAGCSGAPDPEYTRAVPDEPAIPLSAPVGGSLRDFDVERFDPCSTFTHGKWTTFAIRVDEPRPEGAGCRWRGRGLTATIEVEAGRSLAEISADPAFRPGGSGSAGNRYWETATSDAVRSCHAFLAAGPARPDRVVHLYVETDGPVAPVQIPGYADQHACQFVERLTYLTGGILQAAMSPPR